MSMIKSVDVKLRERMPLNAELRRYKLVKVHKNEAYDLKELDPSDNLKIFIVTEVEGANFPDVGLVIDCGMHKKHSEYSATGKYRLQQFFGDEGTVMQRMGRTGRTCNGFYVIMLSESHFEWMKVRHVERTLDCNTVESVTIWGKHSGELCNGFMNFLIPPSPTLQNQVVRSLSVKNIMTPAPDYGLTIHGDLIQNFCFLTPEEANTRIWGYYFNVLKPVAYIVAAMHGDELLVTSERKISVGAFYQRKWAHLKHSEHWSLYQMMKTMFWWRSANRDHLDRGDQKWYDYLTDVFRPAVVNTVEKTLERIEHAFMRLKCIPVGYHLSDRRMFYNANVTDRFSHPLAIEDCKSLVIAAITAGFGHRFTLDEYMPPYADNEESRLKIRSETRFVPEEPAIGVYFRSYEYENGNLRAPMTYVIPSVFAHFSHLGQDNCQVDDTHIQFQTCYGRTIQMEVPNAALTCEFRRSLYNDMIDYILSKQTDDAAGQRLTISNPLVRDFLQIQGGWQFYDVKVDDPESERPRRSDSASE